MSLLRMNVFHLMLSLCISGQESENMMFHKFESWEVSRCLTYLIAIKYAWSEVVNHPVLFAKFSMLYCSHSSNAAAGMSRIGCI